MSHIAKLSKFAATLLAVLTLAGCATVLKMAPTKSSAAVDTSQQSLVLITMSLTNKYHDRYQPEPIVVNIEKPNATQASDRLNFKFDNDGSIDELGGRRYLVRLPLPPGKYVLRGVTGMARYFPFIGNFFTPLHFDIEVKPDRVEYLGHIDAIVVERKDDELRAGSLIPLIDQAATGYSGGTWNITVSDASEHDIAQFRSAFPALAKADIEPDILPPWDKQKATAWWQAH